MKEKKIKMIKTWSEPRAIMNIQIFISFANFYCHFIKSFSRIAELSISILKTTTAAANKPHKIDDENDDVEQDGEGVVKAVGVDENIENLSKTKIIR